MVEGSALSYARSKALGVGPQAQSEKQTAPSHQDPVRRDQPLTTCGADLSVSATKVSVAFVQPPVGSVGEPTTNRFG